MNPAPRATPGIIEEHIYIQPNPELSQADEDIIKELATRGYADPYTLRQRMQGMFPARLLQGGTEEMGKASRILAQHQRAYRRISPLQTPLEPEGLTKLSLGNNQVLLHSASATICCDSGASLLAVVADISGQIAERHVKRMLARHAYGVSGVAPLNHEILEDEIFRLAPVLDIYRLTPDGNIEAGIRIAPGRFDHRSLGDAATMSRNLNLRVLWNKIRAAAPDIKVHYGFGIGFTPDCSAERVTHSDPYTHAGNLHALSRYGNLMARLEQNQAAADPQNPAQSSHNSAGTYLFEAAVPLPSPAQADTPSVAGPEKENHPQQFSALPAPPEATTLSGLKLHIHGSRLFALAGVVVAFGLGVLDSRINLDIMEYIFTHALAQPVLAGACFYFGVRYLRLKRRIQDTPTSKIRSMAMGMVEIHGRVERKYALVSPISGLPCVYYRIRRYTRKRVSFRGERTENQWRLRSITTTDNVPFTINDGTGSAEIKPRGAELKVRSIHGGAGSGTGLPFSINSNMSENERWEEEVIPAGSYVYILGFARPVYEKQSEHKTQLRGALQRLKQDQEKLQTFDRNNDGHIDASEWDAARRATEQEVLARHLSRDQDASASGQAYITHPPQRGYPFLIAETESELHLTRKFTYYSAAFLGAGLGLALWGMYAAGKVLNFI